MVFRVFVVIPVFCVVSWLRVADDVDLDAEEVPVLEVTNVEGLPSTVVVMVTATTELVGEGEEVLVVRASEWVVDGVGSDDEGVVAEEDVVVGAVVVGGEDEVEVVSAGVDEDEDELVVDVVEAVVGAGD